MNDGPRLRLHELGHLVPLLREGMLDSFLRWGLEQRDDFVVWAGPVQHVVVVRPESARQVLAGDAPFVRNVKPTANLFGNGLLRLDGEPWRARRQIFAPALRSEALEEVVAIIHEETDQLIAAWRAREGAFKPTRALAPSGADHPGDGLGAFELTLPDGPPRANLRVSLHPAGLTLAVRPR